MFSSFYSSLSGLVNFSKGLSVLSNNISNMNTQGFKGSTASFQDLIYKNTQSIAGGSSLQIGNGVTLDSTRLDFTQGDIQTTSNDLTAAIDGNGFFILGNGNEQLYTRAGTFEFRDDILVDSTSGLSILGFNDNNSLGEIDISALKLSPAIPTTEVTFENNLSTGGTTHTVTGVTIIDSLGASNQLSLDFTNNTATTSGSWLFDIKDTTDTVISNGEIRFNSDGTLQSGFNSYTFNFEPDNGASIIGLTLNFGEPNSTSAVTSLSLGTDSTLSVGSQNGRATGSILSTVFNNAGELNITYSNTDSVISHSLALAWFNNLQDLTQSAGAVFSAESSNAPIIAKANEGLNGSIRPASIELSNVDLTEEFTDLIVVQRGFQGSSQIISATNELVQELLDLRTGR